MKRFIALILLITVLLCACKPSGNEESEHSEEVSAEDISEVQVSEDDYSPVEKAEVLSAAETLLQTDIHLVSVFAGGSLSDGKLNSSYTEADGKYASYEVFTVMAENTYASEDVRQRMLSYPDYGDDNIINDEGQTKYKYSYINDFAARADDFTVSVVSFDDETATVSVGVSGKTLQIGMEKQDGEWKLSTSVYFAHLQSEADSQLQKGWENSIYLGTRQNAGSAKKLTGKMLILNVFLNDAFTEWTDEYRKKVEDTVDDACDWLITKSRNYGSANLAIDTQSLFYVYSGSITPNYQMAFLDIMFSNTVYVDVNGYVEQNTPAGYDGVCVLFHVWKNGDDYCIPCDTEKTDYLTYYGERAMFYYSKKGMHAPSSYASVILQLCGGETLFGRDDTKEIEKLFPDDLLLEKKYTNLPLQEYSVSPLTAFFVGWSGYADVQIIPFTDIQGE